MRLNSMKTWTHPTLGRFVFDELEWAGPCSLPALGVFRFGTTKRSKFTLSFEAEDDQDSPSRHAVRIAERIVDSSYKLVEKIRTAIWRDLNGKGKDSGMWWHGDLESVLQNANNELPARKQLQQITLEDIGKIVGEPTVWIRKEVDYYEKPCAVVCFRAAFDPEHGLGVLTNGTNVLGLGYQMSVGPY